MRKKILNFIAIWLHSFETENNKASNDNWKHVYDETNLDKIR